MPQKPQVSLALKKEWAVALVLVWVALAKQSMATNVFVRTGQFLLRRKSYGRFVSKPCRNENG
jgi:hypothetical protein